MIIPYLFLSSLPGGCFQSSFGELKARGQISSVNPQVHSTSSRKGFLERHVGSVLSISEASREFLPHHRVIRSIHEFESQHCSFKFPPFSREEYDLLR